MEGAGRTGQRRGCTRGRQTGHGKVGKHESSVARVWGVGEIVERVRFLMTLRFRSETDGR